MVFRVINNNDKTAVSFTIYNKQCSKHLACMISFDSVYNLMREKNYHFYVIDRTSRLRRVTLLACCLTCVDGLRTQACRARILETLTVG